MLWLSNICLKQIKFSHIFYSIGRQWQHHIYHIQPRVKSEGNGLKMKLLTYRYLISIEGISLFSFSLVKKKHKKKKNSTHRVGNVLRHHPYQSFNIDKEDSLLFYFFFSFFFKCWFVISSGNRLWQGKSKRTFQSFLFSFFLSLIFCDFPRDLKIVESEKVFRWRVTLEIILELQQSNLINWVETFHHNFHVKLAGE